MGVVKYTDIGLQSKLVDTEGNEIVAVSSNGSNDYIITIGGSTNKKLVYNTVDGTLDFYVNDSNPGLKVGDEYIVIPTSGTASTSPVEGMMQVEGYDLMIYISGVWKTVTVV